MIKDGFYPKITHLCCFYAFSVDPRSTKRYHGNKKGLSMICKSENLANNYLRKTIKFQDNGLGVLRH